MTGGTRFTRATGRLGTLLVALMPVMAALGYLNYRTRRVDGIRSVIGIVLFVAALGCMLAFFVGLLVRHRRHSWVWPAVVLLALDVVLAFVPGDPGKGLGTAAMIVVGVGVANAGALPRRGGIALVAGTLVGLVARESIALVAVSAVVVAFGIAVLAWAMWREPLSSELRWQRRDAPAGVPARV